MSSSANMAVNALIVLAVLVIIGSHLDTATAAPAIHQKRRCVDAAAAGGNAPAPRDYSDEYNADYSYTDDDQLNDNALNRSDSRGVVQCVGQADYCYAVWMIKNGTVEFVRQGCWDSSDKKAACSRHECVSDVPNSMAVPEHKFCCCAEDLCNANVSSVTEANLAQVFAATVSTVATYSAASGNGNGNGDGENADWTTSQLCFAAMNVTLVMFICAWLIHFGKMTGREPELAPLALAGPGYSSNMHNVDNLKLCSMVGSGRYGTVWKGIVNDEAVAVKIYPHHHKHYFLNEKDIYSQPLIESPALLSYFGCDERRTLEDQIEYLLVLSLAPLGCLQDYLIDTSVTFATFCKLGKSVATGISHLHTEIRKGDVVKPCICHRDLNSRNVLVKADLTACICDFGFALKTFGPRYEYKGEIAVAETKSINEVGGTLRYMAPEVLEGAVNLRDCESALKQIDVYSLGLILWELCVRCQDLYPNGQSPPPYKAPYEAEVGKHPSFEQMQVCVSRHKARPLFPPSWGGGPAARIAKETCEDCWDHDAEARLTALCVEERLQELSLLRPRSHSSRGSTPPLSTNNLASPLLAAAPPVTNTSPANLNDTINITPPNQMITPNGSALIVRDTRSYTPTMAYSPPDEIAGRVKNRAIFSQQIQSFQGRNPCLERNLAPSNTAAIPILVDKSKKHSFICRTGDENSFARLENDVSVEELMTHAHGGGDKNTQNGHPAIMGQGFPKQHNIDQKLKGWYGVRAMIHQKLFRKASDTQRYPDTETDEKSNLVETPHVVVESLQRSTPATRPTNLDLISHNVPELPPPNIIRNFASTEEPPPPPPPPSIFKSPPGDSTQEPAFAVIARSPDFRNGRIVTSKSANAVKSLNTTTLLVESQSDRAIKRQRSLEVFREVFAPRGSSERLRDPSQRVKTPGDVPASVRKVRASKTLSLYDDRMMDPSNRHAFNMGQL